MTDKPTIAVVDDEKDITSIYSSWLSTGDWIGGDVDIDVINGGQEAIDHIDSSTDIVLLDRKMPEVSGREVAQKLDAQGYDGWIVMLTAIEPSVSDCDLIFDDYLVKPVYRNELSVAVERMLERSRYNDEDVVDYLASASKLAAVQEYTSESERKNHDEFQSLKKRVTQLEGRVSDEVRRNHREFRSMLYDLSERTA